MSNECVCQTRWCRNGEAHPAANLMLSVPGMIDAILDIEVEMYTENGRITNHHGPITYRLGYLQQEWMSKDKKWWCLDRKWLVLGAYLKILHFWYLKDPTFSQYSEYGNEEVRFHRSRQTYTLSFQHGYVCWVPSARGGIHLDVAQSSVDCCSKKRK